LYIEVVDNLSGGHTGYGILDRSVRERHSALSFTRAATATFPITHLKLTTILGPEDIMQEPAVPLLTG
tara:strand:- start:478 stop:681 length:204 start_codon:yes stop_codon:yes gene_type:complete